MDSAPKGGGAELVTDPNFVEPPRILLRFGSEAVSVAYWDWYYAEGGSGYRDGFAWIEPCTGAPLNLHYTTQPTGWMPIPGGDLDMDDYQHRLLQAVERVTGRGGPEDLRAALDQRFDQLLALLREIRDRLPPVGGPGGGGPPAGPP